MITFKSTTLFNEKLTLTFEETRGEVRSEILISGFESFDQAKEFAPWYEERHWGYFPKAVAVESAEKGPVVKISIRNSCD